MIVIVFIRWTNRQQVWISVIKSVCWKKIKQLQAQNIALLITTHNPQQAMYLAKNILLLDKQYGGQQGARESLLTLENLAKIYRTSTTQLQQHLHF